MPSSAIALAALLDVAVGVVFVYVAVHFLRRPVSAELRTPTRLFAVWWLGIAASTALGGLSLDGGLLGLAAGLTSASALGAGATTAVVLLWTLAASVGLWGLLAHVVFLYSGRAVHRWLGVTYVGVYALFAAAIVREAPTGVAENSIGIVVRYANPLEGVAVVALLLLLILPQLAGCVAYGTLAFRVRDAEVRYRVALVSSSLVLWLGLSLVAAVAGVATTPAWLVFERVLAAIVAVAVILAYDPPWRIRARLFRNPAALARVAEGRRALMERVRDLV